MQFQCFALLSRQRVQQKSLGPRNRGTPPLTALRSSCQAQRALSAGADGRCRGRCPALLRTSLKALRETLKTREATKPWMAGVKSSRAPVRLLKAARDGTGSGSGGEVAFGVNR